LAGASSTAARLSAVVAVTGFLSVLGLEAEREHEPERERSLLLLLLDLDRDADLL
jgi:hypothetical protein